MFNFPPVLRADRRSVCNLNFFIPVEAVSPPLVHGGMIAAVTVRLGYQFPNC
jgi:hypothetical protein